MWKSLGYRWYTVIRLDEFPKVVDIDREESQVLQTLRQARKGDGANTTERKMTQVTWKPDEESVYKGESSVSNNH